jgi:hypothetical protein
MKVENDDLTRYIKLYIKWQSNILNNESNSLNSSTKSV